MKTRSRVPKISEPHDLQLGASASPTVSVLVLVAGRPEPLPALYGEIAAGVREVCDSYEFVFIVEPAFFEMSEPLLLLAAKGEPIRVVRVGQPLGATALLREGFSFCRGDIVVTLPSRRRVDTAAVAQLITVVQSGSDLAVAARTKRTDSWLNRLESRVFHAMAAGVIGPATRISDVTSNVRAMRRGVLDRLPLYGDAARFLPLLAIREGYKVTEVPTYQHSSDRRRRFTSPLTYLGSVLDLLSLFVVLRFTEKPLRFFGLVGVSSLIPGAAILAVLLVQRLGGQAMADRPLLLLGVLFVVLGIQMVALGLIGEIIVHLQSGDRIAYRLKKARPTDSNRARTREHDR